jgi:hypothetical protein
MAAATHGRRKLRERRGPKVRSKTAVAQIRDMAQKFPEISFRRRGNEAIWTGKFKPTGACATYLVCIEALSGQRPRVWVIEPTLRIPPEKYLETHCFDDGSLCLHLHEEWKPDQFIADTIVAWIPLWLLNYEYWLATGLWHGGGVHPK